MINIELDEKSVFTYDADNLTIHMWDHKDGQYEGPVIGQVGKMKFANKQQLYHFMEMLEYIVKRVENES